LTGTVTFPTIYEADTFEGYHSDSLHVTKENRITICGSDAQTIDWDCVHEGEAEFGVFSDEEHYYRGNESATINNAAAGRYAFILRHRFHEWEKYYYEIDHEIVGKLTISKNNLAIGTYSHNSTNGTDTHIGGYINVAYQDILIVDVECDDDCRCTQIEREIEMTSICPIRAEIRYPLINNDTEFGYHNNGLSVTQEGIQGDCSIFSPLTQWCEHEGDAEFYHNENEPYYTYSTTESIIMRDGRGSYTFKVKDNIEEGMDIESDTTRLHLWTDGMEKAIYTHTIDGTYYDTFDVNVECDDDCTCNFDQEITCEIYAKLKFPQKDKIPDYYGINYGYQNDVLSASKVNETEVCEFGDEEGPTFTSWSCVHDGDARVIKKENYFRKEIETMTIRKALNGEFEFKANHWDDGGEDAYTNTYSIPSTMTLSINDGDMHVFQTQNDTSIGSIYVNVQCDSMCDCSVTQHNLE